MEAAGQALIIQVNYIASHIGQQIPFYCLSDYQILFVPMADYKNELLVWHNQSEMLTNYSSS